MLAIGWYQLFTFFIIATSVVVADDVNGHQDEKHKVFLRKKYFSSANLTNIFHPRVPF